MSFRILVVDDDDDVRDVLTRFLKRRGYLVENARNGQEAIEAVRDGEPDLMLLDINLPKMSGLDVLHEIRAQRLQTRTIALSGIADDRMVSDSKEAGAVAFMAKPLDFPELNSEIDANLIACLTV